jgi:hypothetical protein
VSAIELHQALHGYSGGHRLLVASQRLPREAERALLILTDVSGPVTGGPFESYLTGCAVPGTGAYALVRTWLAPELSRPGCVWSHTLLVDHADLSRLSDPRLLLPLFSRPRKGEPWEVYGRPLTRVPPAAAAAPPRRGAWTDADAARLLETLYGAAADGPAFVAAERPEPAEELILTVWGQQWPRLRRAFRFCTWSLAPRALDGQPFDLQVVPPAVSRRLTPTPAAAVVTIGGLRPAGRPDPPAWARVAAADLVEDGGPLRALLARLGDALSAPRSAYPALVMAASGALRAREGRAGVTELIETVAEAWPRPGDATALKAALFEEVASAAAGLLSPVGEADLLAALATTPRHAAFDRERLAVRRRAAAVWRREPRQGVELARRIVAAGPPTPLGEEFLRGAAEAADPADGALQTGHPALFAALASRNVALARRRAAAPETVSAPAAPARPPDPVPAGSPPATAAPPAGVVARILERLDRAGAPDDGGPTPEERRSLAGSPADVLAWLARTEAPAPRAVVVAAGCVDPYSPAVRDVGVDPWLRAAAGLEAKLDRPTWLGVAAFLLAVAFGDPRPRAGELAASLFGGVDRAAASGELPLPAWRLVARGLPAVPRWREADWADRLRRGLVERFLQHRWPAAELLRAARDDGAFQRVVMICEWSEDGLSLLRRLAAEVSGGRLEATRAQRTLLARYA